MNPANIMTTITRSFRICITLHNDLGCRWFQKFNLGDTSACLVRSYFYFYGNEQWYWKRERVWVRRPNRGGDGPHPRLYLFNFFTTGRVVKSLFRNNYSSFSRAKPRSQLVFYGVSTYFTLKFFVQILQKCTTYNNDFYFLLRPVKTIRT